MGTQLEALESGEKREAEEALEEVRLEALFQENLKEPRFQLVLEELHSGVLDLGLSDDSPNLEKKISKDAGDLWIEALEAERSKERSPI